MCAPRWDSDGVFSSLVGGSGAYAVTPVERFVWGGHYEEGTLIWRSRWITETGIVECREALAFPGDPQRAVLLRRILAVQGDAEVEVVLEPAAGFGSHHLRELRRADDGCWRGVLGDLRLRWTGGGHAEVTGDGRTGRTLRTTLTVPEGVTPVLSAKDAAAPTLSEAAAQGLLPRYDECVRYYAKLGSGGR